VDLQSDGSFEIELHLDHQPHRGARPCGGAGAVPEVCEHAASDLEGILAGTRIADLQVLRGEPATQTLRHQVHVQSLSESLIVAGATDEARVELNRLAN